MIKTIKTNNKQKLSKSIIESFQSGDRQAFLEIYNHTYNYVFKIIYHMIGNRYSDAEDLTHDVYIKLYQSRHKINKKFPIESWIKRMAINHTINSQKRHQIWLKKLGQIYWDWMHMRGIQENISDTIDESSQAEILEKVILNLPPNDRMLLILKEINGHSHQKIAELLDIKKNTVEVRLHRAKKRLKAAYNMYKKGG